MTIRVVLKHHTQYDYDRPTKLHPQVIRLRPAPHSRTPISSYSLKVQPADHFVNWQQDPFGNYLARFVFPESVRSFVIDVEVIADMDVINPFDFFLEEAAEEYPFEYDAQLKRDLAPYLAVTEEGPLLKKWLRDVPPKADHIVDWLVAQNQRLQADIAYEVRMAPGVQTCEETLERASGSCRDSAWLLVQALRHLGLAARFVSGYLVQLKADVEALDGPSGAAEDFTDLHAWTEVYLPGAGWVGLDPTSGLFAGEGHIPLACTPDPASAAPITGAVGKSEVTFGFSNTVTRIHEDPRVTKPFSDDDWHKILTLGDKVERKLEKQDVKLTMGGEPTFVSIDDMDGEEWNYTALSETKYELATDLLGRLRNSFAPTALTHIGQGKWYPGEPLPRWALSLIWRADGEAIVEDNSIFAAGSDAPKVDEEAAEQVVRQLAAQLGISRNYIVPCFEDPWHYLKAEAKLPINLSPLDSKLGTDLDRARMRKVFTEGLNKVVGYALPIKWRGSADTGGWKTSQWPMRDDVMTLIPGDSALGYRLPLDSLPWQPEEEREPVIPNDPFAELPPLAKSADPQGLAQEISGLQKEAEDSEILHTALCVEVRDGSLHIFMPPEEQLDVYLKLVAAITLIAKHLSIKIVLEGYAPPQDPRTRMLQITPDPGVIEVNVHPAYNWRELVETTEKLYEQARQARLGTEKFMLDGRHSGTGGGNHVTLGSAQAKDSPFLRRPDVLGSFIRFWQRHPSLSYLFSGLFIGPTSQAPRVDEARDDNLYELEIALGLLPDGESEQPWMVDRILRNFLVDLTGNTHRAEFCIDKLYAPLTATGRRGLVEFRAFEMPPHARMSVLQMLLIRSLLSWFWRKPYRKPLIRWGTQLHDRFMLRHFVKSDFNEVIADLNEAGLAFDASWFDSFFEFRFPLIGRIQSRDMELSVHNALECWHVLGEEATTQGTSRYVDSSVERVQVTLRGRPSDRYIVTCNGRTVPLRATDEEGTYVAGVRFKAWAQHSSLHATLPVHAPLTFDIVDTANARSISGATYHVAHPGGRNYDTFPLNANEAEARRGARFIGFGGTQGKLKLEPEAPHPDQPYTLDLRT